MCRPALQGSEPGRPGPTPSRSPHSLPRDAHGRADARPRQPEGAEAGRDLVLGRPESRLQFAFEGKRQAVPSAMIVLRVQLRGICRVVKRRSLKGILFADLDTLNKCLIYADDSPIRQLKNVELLTIV